MGSPTIKAAPNITIAWGTTNGTSLGYIVDSLTVTPKNGMPFDVEDGDGFTKIQAHVDDGFDAKASCIYDSSKALPAVGSNITLVAPNIGANGTRNINCTFWTWGFGKTKKKEQMVELNFTNRPEINT